MSYDSLALRLVVQELREPLLEGTIRHFERANPHTFSFKKRKALFITICHTTNTF